MLTSTQTVQIKTFLYQKRFGGEPENTKGMFFWGYSGIGVVGIHQTIVRSRVTLIPEWL